LLSPGLGQPDHLGHFCGFIKRKASPVKQRRKCVECGQGVVEYAGALVVCAMLLAMAMSTVPYNTEEIFDQVTATLVDTFIAP
jgi:transcriptional regulator NrdR family protein